MTNWRYREELSRALRLRRSYYELLRDDLDAYTLRYALIDSYRNFTSKKIPYPFVEKRELKPRGRVPDVEWDCQNAFLLIFVENSLPVIHKKYIRFSEENRTTKANLLRSAALTLSDKFDRTEKYLESVHFADFLKELLPVDYALLIQKDASRAARNQYVLSHFHVKIDWPIVEAAEDLARRLRYISKDIYEKGDKYAEDIQKKFFEYYALPTMAGGRRTAAIVAAQYLRRIPCITTIYAGSCESRALYRICERGVSKAVLIKLSEKEVGQLCQEKGIPVRRFRQTYAVASEKDGDVCIFQTAYAPTSHARPAGDGKLREVKPDLNWIRVDAQHLLPKPGVWKYAPIPLNVIYSKILGPMEEDGGV